MTSVVDAGRTILGLETLRVIKPSARAERVRLILAGRWREALALMPEWEQSVLDKLAPRKGKRT